MTTIAIIGAGWLGAPLAEKLTDKGHTVYASRRSKDNLSAFNQSPVTGFVTSLSDNDSTPLFEQLIEQGSQVVVGCFPPGFRTGGGDNYYHYWCYLIEHAQKANIDKVVMVSSTTVYPTDVLNASEETSSFALANHSACFSDNAKIMLKAEQALHDNFESGCVFRMSGLIGPNRHPARFAPKLKKISSKAPANMVHLDDALNAVIYGIENGLIGVFNVTSPETINKAEFYRAAIKQAQLNVDLPPISEDEDKRIITDRLLQAGYLYQYNSVLDALPHCGEINDS